MVLALKFVAYIDLPEHVKSGGFDHAAVHQASKRIYVAHTANDAIDVIDGAHDVYLHSIPNLIGVAGALVSDARNLVFTSNRGENTVGIFSPENDAKVVKVGVGVRPNGLSFDAGRNLLLAANVGDPTIPGSFTVSMVDVTQRTLLADVAVPGRTRWTVFEPQTNRFYVNIADPYQIVVIAAANPTKIERTFAIPAVGPHGLDIDAANEHIFCACDAKTLVTLNLHTGEVVSTADLSGVPDVIWFNAVANQLYVAVGDPGVIDVFDTKTLQRIATVPTEKGAHTTAFDSQQQKVYAFLAASHRASVYSV